MYNARTMLLSGVIFLILAIHANAYTYAQADNSAEYDWAFDLKPDLTADGTALITVHPSRTWSSYSLTFHSPYSVSSLAAFDYSTGASLQVDRSTTTDGGDKYEISFSQSQRDGYRFRVEFHVSGPSSQTDTGFAFSWSWGGGSNNTPQRVMVQLPAEYNIVSVSDIQSNSVISYTAFWDGTRVIVAFKGTAPPEGYFKWRATASSTSSLPIVTTVFSTIVTSVTTTEPLNNQVSTPFVVLLVALGVSVGFLSAYASLKSRLGNVRGVREHIICSRCGHSNVPGSVYCSECGKLLDTTLRQ